MFRAEPDAFALLDDALSIAEARSRLYTDWVETRVNSDPARLASFWGEINAGMVDGLHAVVTIDYEWGVRASGVASSGGAESESSAAGLLAVRLFRRLEFLTGDETARWLAERDTGLPRGFTAWQASVAREAFDQAIARVHAHIAAGDTYQVNYTYRLTSDAFGDPVAVYRALRARQPVAYAALLSPTPDDERWVLSLSPELFVRHQDGVMVASPMKGTAARHPNPVLDVESARDLSLDTKNRAENVMIVDLLRNDMGRIAVTGSVQVRELFAVQTLPTAHQMTSTVVAKPRADCTFAEVLTSLFPCGSITGAPKHITMKLIDQLETTPRGLYCGAIGWVDAPHADHHLGDFCLSVAIRTLVLGNDRGGLRPVVAGVGGGVVHDSTPAGEWDETITKTRFLRGLDPGFTLFETLRWDARGAAPERLDRHLVRLAKSAGSLGFAFDEGVIRGELARADAAYVGPWPARVKIVLGFSGDVEVSIRPLAPVVEPILVTLAPNPLPHHEAALVHYKTSARTTYDAAIARAESWGAFDTLFFNAGGELTEGARSNVFIRRGELWVTPQLSCGVLPGVMRGKLLEQPGFSEGVIRRDELLAASEMAICNSLRGWRLAQLCAG